MTFSLPEDLAAQFVRRVSARERSRYLAEALEVSLRKRDQDLARACEIANRDPDVEALEREFDAVSDALAEPWNDAPPR